MINITQSAANQIIKSVKIAVFYDVTQCTLVHQYKRLSLAAL